MADIKKLALDEVESEISELKEMLLILKGGKKPEDEIHDTLRVNFQFRLQQLSFQRYNLIRNTHPRRDEICSMELQITDIWDQIIYLHNLLKENKENVFTPAEIEHSISELKKESRELEQRRKDILGL